MKKRLREWFKQVLGISVLEAQIRVLSTELADLHRLYEDASTSIVDATYHKKCDTTIIVASRFKQDHVRIFYKEFGDIHSLNYFLESTGINNMSNYRDMPYEYRPRRKPGRNI